MGGGGGRRQEILVDKSDKINDLLSITLLKQNLIADK
jgi:hypothetical protein